MHSNDSPSNILKVLREALKVLSVATSVLNNMITFVIIFEGVEYQQILEIGLLYTL